MSFTKAELGYWICASYQHLKSFSYDAQNIDEFENTILCGEIALFLNAIRGRNRIRKREIERISKAQKIGKNKLNNNIIPCIIKINDARIGIILKDNKVIGIEEHIDTTEQFYKIIAHIWEMLDPTLIERGAIYVLQHTFLMPRTRNEELNLLTDDGLRDKEAENSLNIATSFKIVQSFKAPKLDDSVLFNPYVWRSNKSKIAHSISRMPEDEKQAVSQCIEQVGKYQALPLDNLHTNKTLLSTAHAIGLLDIVEVNTADGNRKEFLFTPHLTTHPNVTRFADDLLNDVRAVLSCISYGEKFSRISRLGGIQRDKTVIFLNKLIRDKTAGDATAIGVDYQLIEERGIITVEETPTPPGGRYRMRLLREEPIRIALKIIEDTIQSISAKPLMIHTRTLDPASLFSSPEQTRIKNAPSLGQQPEEVKEARMYFLKKIRKESF